MRYEKCHSPANLAARKNRRSPLTGCMSFHLISTLMAAELLHKSSQIRRQRHRPVHGRRRRGMDESKLGRVQGEARRAALVWLVWPTWLAIVHFFTADGMAQLGQVD